MDVDLVHILRSHDSRGCNGLYASAKTLEVFVDNKNDGMYTSAYPVIISYWIFNVEATQRVASVRGTSHQLSSECLNHCSRHSHHALSEEGRNLASFFFFFFFYTSSQRFQEDYGKIKFNESGIRLPGNLNPQLSTSICLN